MDACARFTTQCVYEGNCTPHKVNPGRIRLGNMSYKSSRSAIFFFLPFFFFFAHRIRPSVSLKPLGTADSCHDKAMKKYLPEKLQPRGRYSSLYTELHGNSNLSARDGERESAPKRAALLRCDFFFSPFFFQAKRLFETFEQKINFANNLNILRGNEKRSRSNAVFRRFQSKETKENSSLIIVQVSALLFTLKSTKRLRPIDGRVA